MTQKIKLIQKPDQKLQMKLIGKIKVAEFLSLPEPDFELYIEKMEKDPLFFLLKERYRIITFRKFYDVRDHKRLQLKEEILPEKGGLEVEELLSDNILNLLKRIGGKIGEDNFRRVLSGEMGIKEISRLGEFSSSEISIFKDFIDRFQLQQLLNNSFPAPFPTSSGYFLIASFEWEKGNLVIRPLKEESYLIKGRYHIDYQRLEKLVEEKKISRTEVNKITEFLRQLDMINRRVTTIYRILHQLKEIQRPYFISGRLIDLLPFSQSELARSLGVSPSTISRAIAGKSILTPRGEERPIKFFFSRRWMKNLVKKVILEEKEMMEKGLLLCPLTDEEIKEKIRRDYQIKIARRTVSRYREKLNIPSSHLRYIPSF